MNCKECLNFIDGGLKGISECFANRHLKSVNDEGIDYVWFDADKCSDFVEKKVAERSW